MIAFVILLKLLAFFPTSSCFENEDTDIPTILSVVKERGVIPCNFRNHSRKHDVTMILWYRNNVTNPIYTLDARSSKIESGKYIAFGDLSNRAFFDTIKFPQPSLIIDPIRESDHGTYTCRVDFRSARTFTARSKLDVIIPPEKPVIKDIFRKVVPKLLGPLNENEPLVLICEAKNGRPKPKLKWWRGSDLLDSSDRELSKGVHRNELVISQLDRSNLHAKFSCTASNNNLTAPPETTVQIDMNFKPKSVRIVRQYPLKAGRMNFLKCMAMGSRPPAVITWHIDRRELTKTSDLVTNSNSTVTSTLKFSPLMTDNAKFLTCRARNPQIENSIIEDSFKLTVFYPPEVKLQLEARDSKDIREGATLSLECKTYSNPEPNKIIWIFNGKRLKHQPDKATDTRAKSLQIKAIRKSDSGIYKCAAENIEGRGESNPVSIKVKYAPICKENQKEVYYIAMHDSKDIHCAVEADPPDVAFRWWQNISSVEAIDLTNFTMSKLDSIALYKPQTKYDYGRIYCAAENQVGFQKKPCSYIIKPSEAPESLRGCQLLSSTSDSIDVECIQGYNKGQKAHIVVYVYESESKKLLKNISSVTNSFTISGLPSSSFFTIAFAARNTKGMSKAIILEARTTKHVPKKEENDLFLPIVIGIIAGACLVLFIFIIVFKLTSGNVKRKGHHIHQKKYTDENNDSHERQSPDILPMNRNCITEYSKEDEDYSGGFEEVSQNNMEKISLVQSPIGQTKYQSDKFQQPGGILYAELSLSNVNPSENGTEDVIKRKEEPTEYAQLDFGKMNNKQNEVMITSPSLKPTNQIHNSNSPCSSPVMSCHKKESVV